METKIPMLYVLSIPSYHGDGSHFQPFLHLCLYLNTQTMKGNHREDIYSSYSTTFKFLLE